MRVVDQHGEGGLSPASPATPASGRAAATGGGDHLEPPADGGQRGHGPGDLLGPEVQFLERQGGLGGQEGVVDVDGAGQRRRDPVPAPRELRAARPQHDVARIGMVDGDGRDAGPLQEHPAPGVVRVDHTAQRVARREEHRLRLEVVLHGAVVVEMVVTEIGEDRHVEVDPLDAGLDEGVARHLHRHRVAVPVGLLAVAHAGEDPLHLRRLGRRPCPRERAHHVGGAAGRAEEVAQELGHRRLPVRAGDADHQEVAGGVAVERRRQAGHDGAHRALRDPRLHDPLVDELGDEVLAQQPDGTAVHRLGGVDVAVADPAGNAAEEVPGHDPPAVVRDPADLHGGGVADGLDHLNVVEEEVHGHAWHGRTDSVACLGHPCETAATGVSAKVT